MMSVTYSAVAPGDEEKGGGTWLTRTGPRVMAGAVDSAESGNGVQ